jgi:hypothetical protein
VSKTLLLFLLSVVGTEAHAGSVLVFSDWWQTMAPEAATRLGYATTVFENEPAAFRAAFLDQRWDLVVVEAWTGPLPSKVATTLVDAATVGQPVLVVGNLLDDHHDAAVALGVRARGFDFRLDMQPAPGAAVDFLAGFGGVLPASGPDRSDHGDVLELRGDGWLAAVAARPPGATERGLVAVTNDEAAIVNGFIAADHAGGDGDGDGVDDVVELLEAQIAHLLGGPAVELSGDGTCGAPTDLSVTGLTPGASWALLSARGEGRVVPVAGPCAGHGTDLGPGGFGLRGAFPVDAFGEGHVSVTVPEEHCGAHLQAVDTSTCRVSNVVRTHRSPEVCLSEGFESGTWPAEGWTAVDHHDYGEVSEVAFEGAYSVLDTAWFTHAATLDVLPGSMLSAHVWLGEGRATAFLGFDVNPAWGMRYLFFGGDDSFVSFVDEFDWDFEEVVRVELGAALPREEWLRAEVEVLDPNTVEGRLFDASGVLLTRITGDYTIHGGLGGGPIGIHSFDGAHIDAVQTVCFP